MELLLFGVALGMLILAERMPQVRFQRSPIVRPFFVSDFFYLATGAILLSLVMRAQAVPWAGLLGEGVQRTLANAPFALTVPLAIILHDLGGYGSHILLHRIDALWELHKVHHSSRTLDWLATFRAHILEHTLRHFLSPVLLILLGFPLVVVGIASVVLAIWSALVHANLNVAWHWLEPILITPRLHRLHHVPATSERNLGVFLSVWDRLRGTLEASPTALLHPTGVPGAVETYPQTWPRQFIEPFTRKTEYENGPMTQSLNHTMT
jgi:sterol desaturase/sphingolipid hydroxylase (fatty acid hydroxylase superfamily)